MAISRRKLLASAAALGAVSASAGIFAPAIAQNKPLRVGILAPRSGIAAAPGENGIRATQWAVEKYNAEDGIGGRKVELRTFGLAHSSAPIAFESPVMTLKNAGAMTLPALTQHVGP